MVRARPQAAPWAAAVAWGFQVAAIAAALVFSLGPQMLRGPIVFGVMLASTVAAGIATARSGLGEAARPWWMLTAAEALFFGAAVLRAVLPGADDVHLTARSALPNLVVVPGYLLTMGGVLGLLHRRRAGQDRSARADSLVIGLGAALAVWAFIVGPAIWSSGSPDPLRALGGFFPMFDVMVLVVVVYLLIAAGSKPPSVWLLGVSMTCMFFGDLAYTLGDVHPGSAAAALDLFTVFIILSFGALTSAVVHPSMRTVVEPQTIEIQRIGRLRGAVLSAVLIAPSVLSAVLPAHNTVNSVVRVLLTILLTVAIIRRILRTTESWLEADRDARWRATHDSLTGLANRDKLIEVLTEWSHGDAADRAISLVLLDIDRFKVVNDMWGHAIGDDLLCAVAQRLAATTRAGDLVVRLGADQFAVAMADSPPQGDLSQPENTRRVGPAALQLVRRLVEQFQTPFALSVGEAAITPSIGVATGVEVDDPDELVQDADTAMFEAKAAGRNRYVCFDVSFRERVSRRASIEQALRGALGRDEMAVFYQPIIDLQRQELNGFEALMRWSNPELGSVSPVEFIPVAEETGIIVASGAWLLDAACEQLSAWRTERRADLADLHMSVNLAVRQLRDPALPGLVEQVIERSGLPPASLWLEVTETSAMEDPEASLAVLRRFRDMGISVCIDDFGTGYSSLSYLTQLPARIVKIDRSLVNGLGTGDETEAIVMSVLSMAHILGRQVVAEGIETLVQHHWLRDRGCDFAQGYLYGAPRPAAAQHDWIHLDSLPMVGAAAG